MTNLYNTTKGLQIGVDAPQNDSLRYQYEGTLLKTITWSGPNGYTSVKGSVPIRWVARVRSAARRTPTPSVQVTPVTRLQSRRRCLPPIFADRRSSWRFGGGKVRKYRVDQLRDGSKQFVTTDLKG